MELFTCTAKMSSVKSENVTLREELLVAQRALVFCRSETVKVDAVVSNGGVNLNSLFSKVLLVEEGLRTDHGVTGNALQTKKSEVVVLSPKMSGIQS